MCGKPRADGGNVVFDEISVPKDSTMGRAFSRNLDQAPKKKKPTESVIAGAKRGGPQFRDVAGPSQSNAGAAYRTGASGSRSLLNF